MSKQLIPFNDRVIIKPIEETEQMYGNIVIPDLGKEKPEMGIVISTGPGRHTEFGSFITVNAKVGDVVLIPKIGSLRIDFENEEYFITPDKEILAIIKTTEDE
jgi:chaperonin GroES|tara:strand:+ start:3569 stop:3877 length:309 start_codon:yes stop_codon:yes gene_type:complete